MRKMTAADVLAALRKKGIVAEHCGNIKATFSEIVRDNRDVTEQSLFVCLIGERLDGHIFAQDALLRGATAILAQKGNSALTGLKLGSTKVNPKALILVEDTLVAMQALAAAYRDEFDIPFVGITGSVGKTSTKDLMHAALSGRFACYKTKGNYNNQVGVPLTLFALNKSYEAAVIEMGMEHAGEIERLSAMARPNIAVISNVGISHIENFENRDGILRAKLEIASHLAKDGVLLINGDDERLKTAARKLSIEVRSFGREKDNDCRLLQAQLQDGRLCFEVLYQGKTESYSLQTIGEHMAQNALPAIMAAHRLGLSAEEIQKGFDSYAPSGSRLEIRDNGYLTLIDDTYNASPLSMQAALATLSTFTEPGKAFSERIAVLGDMLELGKEEEDSHRRVGREAVRTQGLDRLYIAGLRSRFMMDEAKEYIRENKLTKPILTYLEKTDDLKSILAEELPGDALVLMKASHSMGFTALADYILKETEKHGV